MTDKNKEIYKKIVDDLSVRGCTNLREAIDLSMMQIEERKHENECTAIFILSDGQDTCGNNLDTILTQMKKRDQQIQKNGKVDYLIHSFGYGSDHDVQVLSAMNKFRNGKFYYISSDEIVDECFIDCLSDLMTVIGNDATIKIKLSEQAEFKTTVGKQWQGESSQERIIHQKYLLSDQTNDYLCFVEVQKQENAGPIKLLDATLSYYNKEQQLSKTKVFSIEVVEGDDLGEVNQEVEEENQKYQSKKVADEAKELYDKGQKEKAREKINHYKKELKNIDCLNDAFQDQMCEMLEEKNFVDEKRFAQQQQVLEGEYTHGFVNFKKQKMFSKNMVSRKKGN